MKSLVKSGKNAKKFRIIRLDGTAEGDTISKEINKVIDEKIDEIAAARDLELSVKTKLKNPLHWMQNRTYLWLQLVIPLLEQSLDSPRSDLAEVLNNIPGDLYNTYEKMLTKSDEPAEAKRIFHLILRPLTPREMHHALASEEYYRTGRQVELESLEQFEVKIKNRCGLLIMFDDPDKGTDTENDKAAYYRSVASTGQRQNLVKSALEDKKIL